MRRIVSCSDSINTLYRETIYMESYGALWTGHAFGFHPKRNEIVSRSENEDPQLRALTPQPPWGRLPHYGRGPQSTQEDKARNT